MKLGDFYTNYYEDTLNAQNQDKEEKDKHEKQQLWEKMV